MEAGKQAMRKHDDALDTVNGTTNSRGGNGLIMPFATPTDLERARKIEMTADQQSKEVIENARRRAREMEK